MPKLRTVLNTIRNYCQKCKNTAAVPKIPQMASLPKARLAAFTRPFTFTGVDYFGPISVIVNRGTQKRWGVVFTCLTTRAVHLEIAYSLDTSWRFETSWQIEAHQGSFILTMEPIFMAQIMFEGSNSRR